ncbi:MAG: hypothetical protein LBV06_08030 [Propionibacteriaceae bacterium]|jgi:hypothetical protein|nr:hypothetical protein [Propionibacteriaceae bacterium]
MKDRDFLDMLEPMLDDDDYVVYGLRVRHHEPSAARRVLEDLTPHIPTVAQMAHPMIQWYLLAFRDHGTIIQTDLADGTVHQVIRVPGWHSDWHRHFACVTIDTTDYIKFSRERI